MERHNSVKRISVLTNSYQAAGGDVEPTSQNPQRLGKAIARRCQTHVVDVCGVLGGFAKERLAIINSEMQS